MLTMQRDVREVARGRWRGILSAAGLSDQQLSGRHGPCPWCGGKDRWRWTNLDGSGTAYCSGACGGGLSAMELLKRLLNADYATAAKWVEDAMQTSQTGPALSAADHADEARREAQQQRAWRREAWSKSQPVQPGDPVDLYLRSRGLELTVYPKALRFHPALRYAEGEHHPAMLAAVQGPDGAYVNIHRTYLTLSGGKADVEPPRRMMRGELPEGSSVRLSEPPGACWAVAEGIETALHVIEGRDVPAWAAISANGLAKWAPPDGVEEVMIYGDNDHSYTGQAAAYTLARRLACQRVEGKARYRVSVHIPLRAGEDWEDHIRREGAG